MLHSTSSVRERLEDERDRLVRDISRLNSEHEVPSAYSNHPADAATDISDDAMKNALLQMQSRHLTMVEDALRRLEAGTYGTCVHCGQRIDPRRLEVLPQAHLCVRCKERREKAA